MFVLSLKSEKEENITHFGAWTIFLTSINLFWSKIVLFFQSNRNFILHPQIQTIKSCVRHCNVSLLIAKPAAIWISSTIHPNALLFVSNNISMLCRSVNMIDWLVLKWRTDLKSIVLSSMRVEFQHNVDKNSFINKRLHVKRKSSVMFRYQFLLGIVWSFTAFEQY